MQRRLYAHILTSPFSPSQATRIALGFEKHYAQSRRILRLLGLNNVPFEQLLIDGLVRHIANGGGDAPRYVLFIYSLYYHRLTLVHVSSKESRRGDEDPSDLYADTVFEHFCQEFPGFSDNIEPLARKPEFIGFIATYVSSYLFCYCLCSLLTKPQSIAAQLVPLARLEEFERDPARYVIHPHCYSS